MLNLREKAHFSLNEFKRGRGSPLTKYRVPSMLDSNSPVEEDDELSVLGGKTRLVAKMEPSSPTILNRSPGSHNPVVPLPSSLSVSGVDPNVLVYLDTFGNSYYQNQSSANWCHDSSTSSSGDQSSFGENSPMQYGMSTIPGSPTFRPDSNSYASRQQPQFAYQSQAPLLDGMQTQPSTSGHTHPQYFPVYYYNQVNGVNENGGINGAGIPTLSSPIQRRGSGTPENMQSTWQDFVTDLGVQ